ncbi:MAG TPA: FtsQ-type POTRA domain-containing protein [Candidatus Acidoferrales bacterium]|nr:FtsQ-type POTRA domain-containing protein [Candidatus Acidoferrales bacterium]
MSRRRPSAARRLRPFWFLIVMLIVLLGVGVYLFARWPAFEPHTIEVEGNTVVGKDAILQSAQINLLQNIWLQNTHAMAERIEAIPYIDTAVVHRQPPGTIVIVVTERVPFAVLDTDGTQEVVDRTLRILRGAGPQDRQLPVLVVHRDENARALADAAREAQAAHLVPESLAYDRFGDLTMTMRDGIAVLFGDPSTVPQKAPLVEPILEKVDRGKRRVTAIDLRALTTPVVIYAR